MRIAVRCAIFALLLWLPLPAADPIFGTWEMRKEDVNDVVKSQTMIVEPTAGGARFSFKLSIKGQPLTYYFITRFDGVPVDAINNGKSFSKITMKKISPREYDQISRDGTSDQHFRLRISPDGKTLVTEGTSVTDGNSISVKVVFNRK
jgi:hypothetical protein